MILEVEVVSLANSKVWFTSNVEVDDDTTIQVVIEATKTIQTLPDFPKMSYKIGIVRRPCEDSEGNKLIGAKRPLTPNMTLREFFMMVSYWDCLFNTSFHDAPNATFNSHGLSFFVTFSNNTVFTTMCPVASHSVLGKVSQNVIESVMLLCILSVRRLVPHMDLSPKKSLLNSHDLIFKTKNLREFSKKSKSLKTEIYPTRSPGIREDFV